MKIKSYGFTSLNITPKNFGGFTIVELLVVIVVIGILAAITIISYTGISSKASVSSLQSDLSNAKKQLALYYVDHGVYPTSLSNNCPTNPNSQPFPDNRYCLKLSSGNTFSDYYTLGVTTSPDGFGLVADKSGTKYTITNSSSPALMSNLATTDSANWIVVGTQVWATKNLNEGTMVPGTLGGTNTTNQTDNATIEKYCYLNDPANCTTYGGLYQWNEAMQYVTTENAQGICPAGSHIPSDNDWKILERQLGMSQALADTTGWRGTDQGTQLKSGNPPGLNMPLAGIRITGGSFVDLSSFAYLWSSSESSTSAWDRGLYSSNATVRRYTYGKGDGFSVRCLGN